MGPAQLRSVLETFSLIHCTTQGRECGQLPVLLCKQPKPNQRCYPKYQAKVIGNFLLILSLTVPHMMTGKLRSTFFPYHWTQRILQLPQIYIKRRGLPNFCTVVMGGFTMNQKCLTIYILPLNKDYSCCPTSLAMLYIQWF